MRWLAILGVLIASSGCSLLISETTFGDGGEPAGDAGSPPEAGVDAGADAGPTDDGGPSPDGGLDAGVSPETPEPAFPWLGYHSQRAPTLRWTEVAGADTYDVEVARGCAAPSRDACAFEPSLTESMSTAETEWNPGALLQLNPSPPRNRTYAWRVRACRAAVCSAWSDVWYFVFGSRLDIDGSGVPDLILGVPDDGDRVRIFCDGRADQECGISGISSGSGFRSFAPMNTNGMSFRAVPRN